MTDEYYMQQALKLAALAYEDDEVPIGAVIVMQNRIIAKAYNQVEKLNDSTAHAEIIALTSAFNFLGSKYLPEATLYVTIEPCLMCAGALYWSKIGKVIYGADDVKHGALSCFEAKNASRSQQVFHPKTLVVKGVHKDDCAALIQQFFKAKR
jgi:tRNA(adenine34) deaminase